VERLRGLGAEPVVCDAFEAAALRGAVVAFASEAVVNELTDRPDEPAATNEANACMRRLGTRNLLAELERLVLAANCRAPLVRTASRTM
jgi:hypothetical protein